MTGLKFPRLARLRRLVREEEGLAAVEFAFAAPVMLLLMLAMVDLGNGITASRNVTAASQIAADLVAQERQLSDAEVSNVFDMVDMILNAPDPTAASATIYSVSMDLATNAVAVDWVETSGTGAGSASTSLPPGLLEPGRSVIVAKITYSHETTFGGVVLPFVGDIVGDSFEISQDAYLRPRRVTVIARTQ